MYAYVEMEVVSIIVSDGGGWALFDFGQSPLCLHRFR